MLLCNIYKYKKGGKIEYKEKFVVVKVSDITKLVKMTIHVLIARNGRNRSSHALLYRYIAILLYCYIAIPLYRYTVIPLYRYMLLLVYMTFFSTILKITRAYSYVCVESIRNSELNPHFFTQPSSHLCTVDCLNIALYKLYYTQLGHTTDPTGFTDRHPRFLQTVDLWSFASTPHSCFLTCLDARLDTLMVYINYRLSKMQRETRRHSHCLDLTISHYSVSNLSFSW